MKGYKALNKDMTAYGGFLYELGKTYHMDGEIKPCARGFHFCKSIADCYHFYGMNDDTVICEVDASGEVKTDGDIKFVTNEITIIAIVEGDERKGNSALQNDGYCNTGNRNTGDWNTGDCNTGCFCTDRNPKILLFDTPTKWTMDDWVKSRARCVLVSCPITHIDVIDGKNNVVDVSCDDRQAWWDALSDDQKQACFDLPNFDADKFCKCIGIKHI